MAENVSVTLQKLANSAQIQVQKLANEATEKTFKYNTQEANAARQWQTQMSNTSHQREVADLKAAGLNPVLSAGGSGAQSYTTSSANAQAENAGSAYANLAGSQINAIGGIEQSRLSAAATRAAAARSAAAMKAAAATQAAAARYAASMNYAASVYHSNKAYEAQKYKTDQDVALKKWVTKNSFANNPTQLVDKWMQNSGLSGHILRSVKANVKDMSSNPEKYFSRASGVNNFTLNRYGKIAVDRELYKVGIKANQANRQLYVKANVYNDSRSIRALNSMMIAHKAARRVTTAAFRGLGSNSANALVDYWSSGRR